MIDGEIDLHSIGLEGMGLRSPVLGVHFDYINKYCCLRDNMKRNNCIPHLD